MLDLTEKCFKVSIINMLASELKESLTKEIMGGMITMLHQINTIGKENETTK